jgi:hypothetical protein
LKNGAMTETVFGDFANVNIPSTCVHGSFPQLAKNYSEAPFIHFSRFP